MQKKRLESLQKVVDNMVNLISSIEKYKEDYNQDHIDFLKKSGALENTTEILLENLLSIREQYENEIRNIMGI